MVNTLMAQNVTAEKLWSLVAPIKGRLGEMKTSKVIFIGVLVAIVLFVLFCFVGAGIDWFYSKNQNSFLARLGYVFLLLVCECFVVGWKFISDYNKEQEKLYKRS